MKSTLTPLCAAIAAAFSFLLATPAAQAQSDIWGAARERLESLQAGKAPKTEPVRAQGAVEQWGAPMPARGLEAAGQAGGRERAQDGWAATAATPQKQALRREQRADERPLDDRGRDERGIDERDARPASRDVVAAEKTQPPAARSRPAPRAKSSTRSTAEERIYGKGIEDDAGAGQKAACVGVSRAWEGAQALAERGEEQRAYDAYLRLLGSCTSEKELVGTVFQAQKTLSPAMLSQLMAEPMMESPKLRSAMFSLKLQQMYAANKANDGKQALTLSREIRDQVLASSDAGALEVSGWLEQRARNPKAAEQLFRGAMQADMRAESAREGLVFALLAQGKLDAAAREAQRLESTRADEIRAEVLLAQARQALEQDQPVEALKLLDKAERLGMSADDAVQETRAWALKKTGQPAKAAKLFAPLTQSRPEDANLAAGLVDSLAAAHDEEALRQLSKGSGAAAQASKDVLARKLDSQGRRADAARLRGERFEGDASAVSAVVGVRAKSGDTGNGRLTETVVPALRGDARVNDSTRVQVDAAHLSLNDGKHTARGGEVRARVVKSLDNAEVAVGAGVSKTAADTKPTFEARGRVYTDNGYVEAGVTHEPVRDSVRSYAGVPVSAPGGSQTLFVGRVMDTSAYIGGSTVLDHLNRYNLDWQLGAGSVSGTRTARNNHYRAEVAVMKDIEDDRFGWLSVGPYASYQSYERDENRFDGLYGGYFSPESDIGMGVQLRAMSQEGGTKLFRASAKAGFVSRDLFYGTDTGVAVEGSVQGAWLLNERIILGTGVSARMSPGYSDVSLRLGVTVPLDKRGKLYATDLNALEAK